MKHTLLYIGLALASFMMQPAAVQAKAKKEAVEGHVVVHSPGVVLLLRGSEVNVADYCLVASCPEIALHVGEVYVASVEKTACIAVAVEC